MNCLELAGMKTFRGGKCVLDIYSFEVKEGELVSIIGPNGAGKSSLLQVINGLLPFQEGTIKLFGTDFKSVNMVDLRRRCAMVFQETLFVMDSVYHNVAMPLRFRGFKEHVIKERVKSALETFKCAHLSKRLAPHLSGGESQRVCLARAFVSEPEILLLDEPFAALDPATRNKLLQELKEAALSRGMTVILISHSLDEVLRFAERTIVMEQGNIVQDDLPEVIMRRPASMSIAQLVGMDNILPCKIDAGLTDSRVVLSDGTSFPWEGSNKAASYCCLPGDVFFLLEEYKQTELNLIPISIRVTQIIPGIGVYQINGDTKGFSLCIRLPKEKAALLHVGMDIKVAFDPASAHII